MNEKKVGLFTGKAGGVPHKLPLTQLVFEKLVGGGMKGNGTLGERRGGASKVLKGAQGEGNGKKLNGAGGGRKSARDGLKGKETSHLPKVFGNCQDTGSRRVPRQIPPGSLKKGAGAGR